MSYFIEEGEKESKNKLSNKKIIKKEGAALSLYFCFHNCFILHSKE